MKPKDRERSPYLHDPVMVDEVLDYLDPAGEKSGLFVDATTSTGGHSLEIATGLGPDGTLVGLDLDRSALEVARERLSDLPPEVKLYQANYRELEAALDAAGAKKPDGILFDLGFSSFQIEDPERGFSFQKDGPLDMRMDPGGDLTAKEIVNNYSFRELKSIITRYGEENWADGIAKEIVDYRKNRKITTTNQLTEIIESAIPEGVQRQRNHHPATRTFQALRIAVNQELENLEEGLETAFAELKEGGVMVVISYHSLEDRRVKRFLKYKEKDCICPPDLPVCRCDKISEARLLSGGAVRPSQEEVEDNPRARSARLRAAEKIGSE